MDVKKVLLTEDEIPRQWYNITAVRLTFHEEL